jgi:hypothetical protein
VEQAEFESWQPAGRRFGLVYSAQAWHWIRREIRCVKARTLLRRDGALAAFWSRPDWEHCAPAAEIDAQYRAVAPELVHEVGIMRPSRLTPRQLWGETAAEIKAATGYERPVQHEYRWTQTYSASEYVALLWTHSDHILLPDDDRDKLLEAVASVIDGAGGGKLALDYVTSLTLARVA